MPSGHSAELPHLPCSSRPRPELPLSRFLPGLLDQLLPLGLPGRLLQSVLSGLPLRLPLLDRSLPPDPALLSLQPDPPGLLLRLLLLLPPGPALLPLRPGLSDPSLPPAPALLSLQPDLPDLLLRLLLLDPALLPLQLGLPGLLLRLLLLDQSLLPDLALLSLPPGRFI